MNNLKIMIFGDYTMFGGKNIIIEQEDNMKPENVKVTDYKNKIINMKSLASAYFSAIEKGEMNENTNS